jgi:catechol 2,3-dioxygenase-like lactoylglutathione lyase family enzyme
MPEEPHGAATAFDHLAHQVPDVAAAIAWYQKTIPNCRVLYQDASWGFIEAAGLKLALVQGERHPEHIGWQVREADLERLAAEHGQKVCNHRDGTRGLYLPAPGGHWIEFIAYPPGSLYARRPEQA